MLTNSFKGKSLYSNILGVPPSLKRGQAAGYSLYAAHAIAIPYFYAASPCRAPAIRFREYLSTSKGVSQLALFF